MSASQQAQRTQSKLSSEMMQVVMPVAICSLTARQSTMLSSHGTSPCLHWMLALLKQLPFCTPHHKAWCGDLGLMSSCTQCDPAA